MKRLEEMFQIQDKLNSTIMGADYKDKNIPFYRAAIVEASELYEHCGFKWWKHNHNFGKEELEQAQLEIIDIYHFLMSQVLSDSEPQEFKDNVDFIKTQFKNIEEITHSKYTKEQQLESIDDFIRHITNYHFVEEVAVEFVALMNAFELDFEQLYRTYIGKNALNYFRQENGYKDGTYIKDSWIDLNGNKVEDNVVLSEILETDWETFQDVYNALEERYKDVI